MQAGPVRGVTSGRDGRALRPCPPSGAARTLRESDTEHPTFRTGEHR